MERLAVNTTGRPHEARLQGKLHIVAPLSLIVPGVLPGSKGPLLYTHNTTAKFKDRWNGMPLALGHPMLGGKYVTARHPTVEDKFGLGRVYNARIDTVLKGQGWFDVAAVERVHPPLIDALRLGQPVELSTGLGTRNVRAPGVFNGRQYWGLAEDHEPDHVAVLVNEIGACSILDGCGVNVNARSIATGRFKPVGSGFGRGPVHSAAQGGAVVLDAEDLALGASIYDGAVTPDWVTDGDLWAKAVAETSAYDRDNFWATAAHIYRRLGGVLANAFCPTGPGGGVDPSCGGGDGSGGGGDSVKAIRGIADAAPESLVGKRVHNDIRTAMTAAERGNTKRATRILKAVRSDVREMRRDDREALQEVKRAGKYDTELQSRVTALHDVSLRISQFLGEVP